MSYFSQEIAAHHPFFVFQRHNGLEFPGDVFYFGFAEEMEETGFVARSQRSRWFSIFIWLDSLVTVVGDAAHGDAGDSGVGVAVQVGIAELLVLFFGGFLYGGVGGNSFLMVLKDFPAAAAVNTLSRDSSARSAMVLPVESLSFKSGRNSMLLLSCTKDDLAVWVFLFFGQFNGVAAEEEIRDFVDADVICCLF